ncbi:uncharacterized protein LOC129584290 [Paramacrobiotus metropolitanus]|uniref:uncharacterized protein LOC129584290 n=1 Tax=Paramacrobiotus metropolitanus TaxID=2943436 RepID=UPI002445E844|nr:uncharacterized protein LOC129584290 [Paramacrobiotus metropolitanus]
MAASFKCFALLLLCVTSFTNGGITIIKNAFSLPNKVDTGVTLSGRTLKYQCRHLQPAFGPLTAVCQTITKCPPGSVQARVKSSVPQQFTAKTALYHVDWQCEGENRIMLVDYQPEKGTVGLKDANNGSTVIRQDTPYFATCAFFEDKAKKNIVECYNYEYCSYRLGKLVCAGIPAYGGTWTGDIKTGLNGKFDAIMQPNRNKTCNQDLPAVLGKEQKANEKLKRSRKSRNVRASKRVMNCSYLWLWIVWGRAAPATANMPNCNLVLAGQRWGASMRITIQQLRLLTCRRKLFQLASEYKCALTCL